MKKKKGDLRPAKSRPAKKDKLPENFAKPHLRICFRFLYTGLTHIYTRIHTHTIT